MVFIMERVHPEDAFSKITVFRKRYSLAKHNECLLFIMKGCVLVSLHVNK